MHTLLLWIFRLCDWVSDFALVVVVVLLLRRGSHGQVRMGKSSELMVTLANNHDATECASKMSSEWTMTNFATPCAAGASSVTVPVSFELFKKNLFVDTAEYECFEDEYYYWTEDSDPNTWYWCTNPVTGEWDAISCAPDEIGKGCPLSKVKSNCDEEYFSSQFSKSNLHLEIASQCDKNDPLSLNRPVMHVGEWPWDCSYQSLKWGYSCEFKSEMLINTLAMLAFVIFVKEALFLSNYKFAFIQLIDQDLAQISSSSASAIIAWTLRLWNILPGIMAVSQRTKSIHMNSGFFSLFLILDFAQKMCSVMVGIIVLSSEWNALVVFSVITSILAFIANLGFWTLKVRQNLHQMHMILSEDPDDFASQTSDLDPEQELGFAIDDAELIERLPVVPESSSYSIGKRLIWSWEAVHGLMKFLTFVALCYVLFSDLVYKNLDRRLVGKIVVVTLLATYIAQVMSMSTIYAEAAMALRVNSISAYINSYWSRKLLYMESPRHQAWLSAAEKKMGSLDSFWHCFNSHHHFFRVFVLTPVELGCIVQVLRGLSHAYWFYVTCNDYDTCYSTQSETYVHDSLNGGLLSFFIYASTYHLLITLWDFIVELFFTLVKCVSGPASGERKERIRKAFLEALAK